MNAIAAVKVIDLIHRPQLLMSSLYQWWNSSTQNAVHVIIKDHGTQEISTLQGNLNMRTSQSSLKEKEKNIAQCFGRWLEILMQCYTDDVQILQES